MRRLLLNVKRRKRTTKVSFRISRAHDARGKLAARPVRPGAYTARVSLAGFREEIAQVTVSAGRYKVPGETESRLQTLVVRIDALEAVRANLGFASAVAELGLLLRQSPQAGRAS